jgi:hypothetical protein
MGFLRLSRGFFAAGGSGFSRLFADFRARPCWRRRPPPFAPAPSAPIFFQIAPKSDLFKRGLAFLASGSPGARPFFPRRGFCPAPGGAGQGFGRPPSFFLGAPGAAKPARLLNKTGAGLKAGKKFAVSGPGSVFFVADPIVL